MTKEEEGSVFMGGLSSDRIRRGGGGGGVGGSMGEGVSLKGGPTEKEKIRKIDGVVGEGWGFRVLKRNGNRITLRGEGGGEGRTG